MNWYKKAQENQVIYDIKTVKDLSPSEIDNLKSLSIPDVDLAPTFLEEWITPPSYLNTPVGPDYASLVRIIEAKIKNNIVGWILINATPEKDIC